ncbi:MAG: tyrosine--tRNA ligase [Candidatus Aenigmatarchaeota archaeon]|nr:MAG: tyrosine--tRNA ligase [Candidatus Aenigmarchaeota archaeon ex4484_14]RLI97622.1 MAG: tyrosine--tRNA ligase [Candidatus Aenigmarchaeota archaeon]
MNLDRKLRLIKGVAEEIVTEEELLELLEEKKHPIAYDGFEPSGMAHLPFGIYRAMNLKDLLEAGIHFKLLIADWHAWINNKMGGDLERIQRVGKYFVEVWKAAGVDIKKIDIVWASDLVNSSEYWKKVVLIGKSTTLKRATRCLSIMGRKEGELKDVAQYIYPMMQCADIFQLEADICQLGLDQRRVNILAREIGPKLGWWKPVVVSHHMLMGLQGIKEPEGFDENKNFDKEISSKMSKSKVSTAIFVHDTEEEIREKIRKAYCPEKITRDNPVMEYAKYLIFRSFKTMKLERPEKFGGDVEFSSYGELEKAYLQGDIHPLDLKNAVAKYINLLIKPVREHFEKNEKARELYEFVKTQRITR